MRGVYWYLALAFLPIDVFAQTSVGACDNLPTSVDEDTEVELTSATVSCSSFMEIIVTGGATFTLSSTQTETTLENLRIQVESDSAFVSLVPSLTWTSSQDTFVSGAALRVESGGSVTFSEDVTFSECLSFDGYQATGGAISNSGTLTFAKTATFVDTIDGGAIYNGGNITFQGDASFINNKLTYDGDSYNFLGADGAGIHNWEGRVTFEGAAYFSGNEVTSERSLEYEGIFSFGGTGAGIYTGQCYEVDGPGIIFEGEATFVGNKGRSGSAIYVEACGVRFEALATFTDNEAKAEGDESSGGAIAIYSYTSVEFEGGLTVTGNAARNGGAFFLHEEATMTVTGPMTMTGNEARYSGGAIYNKGTVVLPADANVSDNVAVSCPGIFNSDNGASDPLSRFPYPQARVEFTGGVNFSGPSMDLCYLGAPTISDSTPVSEVLDVDCDAILSAAPLLGSIPIVILDTREVSSLDLGGIGDAEFTCSEMLMVLVTGGGELVITSAAGSITLSKVRFEVLGYTRLIFDLPPTTITGFDKSVFGGTMYIERGSSLDVMDEIVFKGNTFGFLTDFALEERGGAAIYSAGDVKFYGKAYFLENGFYEPDGAYSYAGPGGAVLNIGYMEFMKKATFNDNFIAGGSNGGGMANGGTLIFNLRGIFRNNTVENNFNDDGDPFDGHGGGLYNGGDSATVQFKRLAIFQDNVGGFRSAALATVASEELDDGVDAGNKITFEAEAKFKDNTCKTIHANSGGAGLWVYGLATVDFQDRAIFKRNNATNGGAIMNTGSILFASADLVTMEDNIASETCPDIKNFDKDDNEHFDGAVFGSITESGSVVWYEGTVTIGDDVFVGESAEICEFP